MLTKLVCCAIISLKLSFEEGNEMNFYAGKTLENSFGATSAASRFSCSQNADIVNAAIIAAFIFILVISNIVSVLNFIMLIVIMSVFKLRHKLKPIKY